MVDDELVEDINAEIAALEALLMKMVSMLTKLRCKLNGCEKNWPRQ